MCGWEPGGNEPRPSERLGPPPRACADPRPIYFGHLCSRWRLHRRRRLEFALAPDVGAAPSALEDGSGG
jgi:hypothetical protein